jgi:hypothetical protein
MSERELLKAFYNFVATKDIVQGDKDSMKDMAQRYKNPPISMAFPVVMRMTVQDSHTLNDLMSKAEILLVPSEVTPLSTPIVKPEDEPHEP